MKVQGSGGPEVPDAAAAAAAVGPLPAVKLPPLLLLRPPPPPLLLLLLSQRLGLNSPASGPKVCFAIAMGSAHSITTVPCVAPDMTDTGIDTCTQA
jgi:hypothetical protein